LNSREAKIEVEFNRQPELVRIDYGQDISATGKSVTSISKLVRDWLNISELSEGVNYYFRITVTDNLGKWVRSEIFTFRTPVEVYRAGLEPNSLIVTSQNNIIQDSRSEQVDLADLVVVPVNLLYSFKVNMVASETVKEIKVALRDTQVLGITSVLGAQPNSWETNLIAIDQKGFSGQLISPSKPGFYELYAKISDIYGNITEEKIADLRVMEPIVVINERGSVIEGAKVLFYRYDDRQKRYQILPSQYMGMINPNYSETNGEVLVALPKGKYRVEVSEIGYQMVTADFIIGRGENEVLPTVVLGKRELSAGVLIGYFSRTGSDVFNYLYRYVGNLLTSGRFFRLMILIQLILMLVLIDWWVSYRLGLRWYQLVNWGWKKMSRKRSGNKDKVVGRVVDSLNRRSVGRATVYLIDRENNQVLDETVADNFGWFQLIRKKANRYGLAVSAVGFETSRLMDYSREGLVSGELELRLERFEGQPKNNWYFVSRELGQAVMGMMVVGFLIMQLLFIKKIGLNQTAGPLVMALINVILWFRLVLYVEKKSG